MQTKITNYLSRLLFSDTSESFVILVFLDFSSILEKERMLHYMYTMVEKNPILKQRVIQSGNQLYFEDAENFDLSLQYEILEKNHEDFDTEAQIELNKSFTTELQWRFLWYQDTKQNKQRLLFKIHHGYGDGYKLIEMFTSPFQREKLYERFKRKTSLFDMVYSLLFGTLSLFFMNIHFLFGILFSPKKQKSLERKNEIYSCKPIPLEKVKTSTKKKGITINDFFYAVMTRADYLYHEVSRDILTISPMNISQKEATNNIMPVFIKTSNSDDPPFLLQKVHDLFNSFKYSFFIPFLHFLVVILFAIVPLHLLSWIYEILLEQSDYVYTNVMGPSRKFLLPQTETIRFVVKAKDNEVVYNILSYEGLIHICLSFKEGTIQDKERFEQCIYKAYEELIS